jgi:hypothetical protein
LTICSHHSGVYAAHFARYWMGKKLKRHLSEVTFYLYMNPYYWKIFIEVVDFLLFSNCNKRIIPIHWRIIIVHLIDNTIICNIK